MPELQKQPTSDSEPALENAEAAAPAFSNSIYETIEGSANFT